MNKDIILNELCNGRKDEEIISLIEKFEKDIFHMHIKKTFKIFKTEELKEILIGNNVKDYSKYSTYCAVFVITLGIDVDKRLRFYEKTNKLDYIIFDKVASHYIEDRVEILQNQITEELLKYDRYVMKRFCTGYGDFPLNINNNIVDILDANKFGIYTTDKSMFIPSKTIGGIIASSNINEPFNFCKSCNIKYKCRKKERGESCFE